MAGIPFSFHQNISTGKKPQGVGSSFTFDRLWTQFYYLERNEQAGIVYHREGIMGDYDEFDDLEELITYIRTGKR